MSLTTKAEDAAPLHDLNSFQRDTLMTVMMLNEELDTEEVSGLRVKEELDGLYEDKINHGRLYPALDHLVEIGFLVKSEVDGRTNGYEITRRGRRELENHARWFGQSINK